MSMLFCDSCGDIKDSDDDPEGFCVEDGLFICDACREDDSGTIDCPACLGTGIGQSGPPDVSQCYNCKGRGYFEGEQT